MPNYLFRPESIPFDHFLVLWTVMERRFRCWTGRIILKDRTAYHTHVDRANWAVSQAQGPNSRAQGALLHAASVQAQQIEQRMESIKNHLTYLPKSPRRR